MAGISEHIHQSGHPFPLGLYIGFTRLHGVALVREGTMFDSGQGPLFGFGLPGAAATPGCQGLLPPLDALDMWDWTPVILCSDAWSIGVCEVGSVPRPTD